MKRGSLPMYEVQSYGEVEDGVDDSPGWSKYI
jgi:hypothetical protein